MDYISWEIFLIAIALAMDAFAISVSFCMSGYKKNVKQAVMVAIYFGGFQGLMPLLGWVLGSAFSEKISTYGFIVSFIILSFLGTKMIVGSLKNPKQIIHTKITNKVLILLAIATSIDAFAIGVSFAVTGVNQPNMLVNCIIISLITGIICFTGYFLGDKLSKIINIKTEIVGGIILLIFAFKILIENIFIR